MQSNLVNGRWLTYWQPKIKGTDVDRVSALEALQNIYEGRQLTSVLQWVPRIGKLGLLNQSQAASLLGVTRQHMSYLIKEYALPFDDRYSVRGNFDARALEPMIKLVYRLQRDEAPTIASLLDIQTGTDKSVVQLLTGVPLHILRKVTKHVGY